MDHIANDGSKVVAVTTEIDDVEGIMATLASPPAELAEVMQRHGVQPPLTAYVQK